MAMAFRICVNCILVALLALPSIAWAEKPPVELLVSAPPEISGLDGNVVIVARGDTTAYLDQGASVTLSDPDSADFSGGSATATISGNFMPAFDSLLPVSRGLVAVSGANIKDGIITFGQFAWDSTAGELSVLFTSEATTPRVEALLKALRYSNANVLANTSDRTIVLEVNDGDGATSLPQTVTIRFADACLLQSGFEESDGC